MVGGTTGLVFGSLIRTMVIESWDDVVGLKIVSCLGGFLNTHT